MRIRTPHRLAGRVIICLLAALIAGAPGRIPPAAAQTPAQTKNDTEQPPADPAGVTVRAAAPLDSQITAHAGFGARSLSCGSRTDGAWTTTSAAFVPIETCAIDVRAAGFFYIMASASVGLSSDHTPFEARFGLGIDSSFGDSVTDRWVNIYPDTGNDKNVATSLIKPVSAGAHTVSFLGARYAGGTVRVEDPSLTVLFFPGNGDVLSCGVSDNLTWITTEAALRPIQACSLDLPAPGFVYLSGTASVGLSNKPFEARLRLGVDAIGGTASTDRLVNVYGDGGDGTDEVAATSLLTAVVSGTHIFSFSGARSAGDGTVQLYDPILTVLFFPTTAMEARVCGAVGGDPWTNDTDGFTTIRSCTIDVPQDSLAFVDASASVGLAGPAGESPPEGHFRIGVDSPTGLAGFDRWVDVADDAGDGSDRSIADTGLISVAAGERTFSFVGRRSAGTGALRVHSPVLSVIVPTAPVLLPLIAR